MLNDTSSMLFGVTLLVDLVGMATTLWMAFYLFGKGFPSRITLRAVFVLFLISIFFLGVYASLFGEIVTTVSLRAVLVVAGLGAWYDLTYQLMTETSRKKLRALETGIVLLAAVAGILMLGAPTAFNEAPEDPLYISHIGSSPAAIFYLLFLLVISVGILYNLLSDKRIGLNSQGKYFLLASIIIISGVGYGFVAVAGSGYLPRLVMDLLILGGVTLLGLSVARHQSLIERRTTMQDFPLSSITILGISVGYGLLGLRWGIPPGMIAALVAVVIATHSIYELVREFLERQRIRKESSFRSQLRQLQNERLDEETLRPKLQEGLDLLCQTLNSSGGFIAVRRAEVFTVIATLESMRVGSEIPLAEATCEDIVQPASTQLSKIVWIAPSFGSDAQVGVIGLLQPKDRLEYTAADLDLLVEVANQVGTMVSLSLLQPLRTDKNLSLVSESGTQTAILPVGADEILATITTNPDPEFVKSVEDGLRHLSDYFALGQSALAEWFELRGESELERGKKLHAFLLDSIESLRPMGTRPAEPLPRLWYSYSVLYDAYVEGVPNREIMARLYISEGTFNRTRRRAIRGLARLLVERQKIVLEEDR